MDEVYGDKESSTLSDDDNQKRYVEYVANGGNNYFDQ